jgi:murein DD-endopeptidase MepM/ murein hydrolase activator NlpD
MTSKFAASILKQTIAAAIAPRHDGGTGRAHAGACLVLLIDLLVPVLLLAGCATGFGSSQGERDYAVIGYGTSGPRTLLLRPVANASLSSPFGERLGPMGGGGTRMHRGIDLAAPSDTPVRAAGDGVVISVGPRGAYGHYVCIRHDDTYETAYAHLSRYADRLERGAQVRQGEVIGYVGSSGRSTAPHLHYEVLVDGIQVDPFEVGPSLAQSIKGGAVGSVRAVGEAFLSAGKAVTGTAKRRLIEPVGRIVAGLTGED